jgi:diaminohydroxyphosphoribosylaminopyrimidine deaminase/5-amino-6-(5-phosphoribosylamino)uracil reductase
MQHALRLAARGLGHTWPNPSVGAIVVKDGAIAGTGVTARGGRPHAESQALEQAGDNAKGATLYVSLEPCAHQGKTPACTQGIIASGIRRVVAGCTDPNPLVSGKGFAQLRAAGIEVEEGVCEPESLLLNEGFFSVHQRGRPFVTLKVATSLDGKIAAGGGESKWITGEESRFRVHALRASHDAVLTGIGTVLYDDPLLTCRLSGRAEDSPQRAVMDSDLRIPLDARLLPAWIFTSEKARDRETPKIAALEKAGSKVFAVPQDAARLSLPDMLETLTAQGITRLLVEAGSALASELMRHDLVDRLYWFRAPLVIGDKGIPALWGQDGTRLADLPRLSLRGTERWGADRLEIYDCAE